MALCSSTVISASRFLVFWRTSIPAFVQRKPHVLDQVVINRVLLIFMMLPDSSTSSKTMLTADDRGRLVKDALSRLYLIQFHNTVELLASLHTMWSLMDADPGIRLIVLDSITGLHLLDGLNPTPIVPTYANSAQRGAARMIKLLLHDFANITVLAVKGVLFYNASGAGVGEYMDKEWAQIVNQRFILHVQQRAVVSATGTPRQHVALVHLTTRQSCTMEISSTGIHL